MGNMKAESGFSPTNAQDSYGYKGFHNPEYIPIYNAKDDVGWGLIQWTFSTRKQGLLDYANEKGTSVDDIDTQLEYLCIEFDTTFKSQYQEFIQKEDIEPATDYFCREIAKPGAPNYSERQGYAKGILEKFKER